MILRTLLALLLAAVPIASESSGTPILDAAFLPKDPALLGLDQATIREAAEPERPLADAMAAPGVLGCYGSYGVTYRPDTGHFCPYAISIVYVDTETFSGCVEGCGIWIQYQISDWQGNPVGSPDLLGAEGSCGTMIGSWPVLCPDLGVPTHAFADVTLYCDTCEIIPDPF